MCVFGIKRAMGRPVIGAEEGLESLPCVRRRARYRWSAKRCLHTELNGAPFFSAANHFFKMDP